MMIAKEKLSAMTTTKLGIATTAAALWIATVTFTGAAVTPVQSTSAASARASHALKAKHALEVAQVIRDIWVTFAKGLNLFLS